MNLEFKNSLTVSAYLVKDGVVLDKGTCYNRPVSKVEAADILLNSSADEIRIRYEIPENQFGKTIYNFDRAEAIDCIAQEIGRLETILENEIEKINQKSKSKTDKDSPFDWVEVFEIISKLGD